MKSNFEGRFCQGAVRIRTTLAIPCPTLYISPEGKARLCPTISKLVHLMSLYKPTSGSKKLLYIHIVGLSLNTYVEYIFWVVGIQVLLMKSVEFIHEFVTEMTLE